MKEQCKEVEFTLKIPGRESEIVVRVYSLPSDNMAVACIGLRDEDGRSRLAGIDCAPWVEFDLTGDEDDRREQPKRM